MNDVLGTRFNVLDDGYIRLVDVMGTDTSIVEAARVSYSGLSEYTGDDKADRRLIRYLMRNGHWTPFEMCELKFMVRVPISVWRQWIRHRTASVNEVSTRYREHDNSYYTVDKWRMQSKSNKQGSEGEFSLPLNAEFSDVYRKACDVSYKTYKMLVESGISKESARDVLPLSSYTEAYWKCDLRNLLNFLRLRMDNHAQFEIRQYANVIGNEIVAKLFPFVWESFNDYILNAVTFSAGEINILKQMLKETDCGSAESFFPEEWASSQSTEKADFLNKLKKLGL